MLGSNIEKGRDRASYAKIMPANVEFIFLTEKETMHVDTTTVNHQIITTNGILDLSQMPVLTNLRLV